MDDFTKIFLTYNYGEAKDLAKAFLTLISAILVFSITFSDKVVNFQNASRRTRVLLTLSWVLFVGAIVLCGISLLFYYNSLWLAVHCAWNCTAPLFGVIRPSPTRVLVIGNNCILLAGMSFVLGLIALVLSAISSIRDISPVKVDIPADETGED
jgi:hypothetical protein